MTRITALECEYQDIEWYGIDAQGNIAVFCSGGTGNIPEFVCVSQEITDELIAFFRQMEPNTTSIIMSGLTPAVAQCARNFSDKGLYYFDANDGDCHPYYLKQSSPNRPLCLEQLPDHIKGLLSCHRLNIESFALVNTIAVPHAYS